MTQKDKIREAFMALANIRNIAFTIYRECDEYSTTASTLARNIVDKCDHCLKQLK